MFAPFAPKLQTGAARVLLMSSRLSGAPNAVLRERRSKLERTQFAPKELSSALAQRAAETVR